MQGNNAISTQYFNSIKVRLKHEQGIMAHYHAVFQFHKGTIKTLDDKDSRKAS